MDFKVLGAYDGWEFKEIPYTIIAQTDITEQDNKLHKENIVTLKITI